MIPANFSRVGWVDLKDGDMVSLISIANGNEYASGLYKVVDVKHKKLHRQGSRFYFSIGGNCLRNELLIDNILHK